MVNTMAGIFDMLTKQLSGSMMDQLSEQIGADKQTTEKAVAAALPVLLGGLSRNASSSPQEAAALAGALERDHDGSLLDVLGGMLGGSDNGGGGGLGSLIGAAGALFGGQKASPKALDGAGILGHILGQRRTVVEEGVSKASGLDLSKVARLLVILAPIVMGALGRMKKEENLDAGSLAGALAGERQRIEARAPGLAGGLVNLLDSDDDGQVMDDLVKLGGSGLLGKLFN
jgi:hypothetical protein